MIRVLYLDFSSIQTAVGAMEHHDLYPFTITNDGSFRIELRVEAGVTDPPNASQGLRDVCGFKF